MADESSDIAVVIKSLDQFTERVMKKLTLDITANLIETTPVDTGWARANWIPSLSQASQFEPEGGISKVGWGTGNNRKERASKVPEAASAQSTGLTEVGTYQLIQGPIYISNNTHYIEKLNEGWSTQAPSNFVERAIEQGISQNASISQ